jgi:hypothetical protein
MDHEVSARRLVDASASDGASKAVRLAGGGVVNPSECRRSRAGYLPTWWAFGLLCAGILGLGGCEAESRPVDAGASVDDGDVGRTDAGAPDAGRDEDGGAAPDAGDDAGAGPTPDCFDGPVAVIDEGTRVIATTEHYRLEAESDAARASEWVRLLEAAYAQQISIFDASLTPASLPLRVKVFRDAASFRAGLAADGLGAVGEAGGYYEPSNETAYLSVQPTRYYTQVLLVHEAVHQIHDLARAAPSLPFWYIEGLAEALARHDWDGRCARLATRPLLSQEDTPLDARDELASGGPSLAAVVSGTVVPSRPVAQTIFRYLMREDGGPLAPAFVDFRRAVDRGTAPMDAFVAAFGAPMAQEAAWRSFVDLDQEPMSVVYVEWTHVDSTRVIGRSPGVFSIARVKNPLSRFELAFAAPSEPGWSGGVLLGYESAARWEALVVRSDGRLARFDVNGSAFWNDVGAAPAAVDGGWRFEVEHTTGRVDVRINGTSFSFANTLPPISGPAIDSGEIRFTDIRWAE